MKIFINYPIVIQTKCLDEDSLVEQINEIKKLKEVGFDFPLFFNVLSNAHNRSSTSQRNSFLLVEWKDHFSIDKIEVSLEQLESFFEYLMRFHKETISHSNKRYILLNSPEKQNFGLEFVVFKSIEY
jgi:hypothetical protein